MLRPLLVTAILACLAAAAAATTVGQDQFKCPACGATFSSWVNPSYTTFGADDEGRPRYAGEDIQKYRLHACPKCHFAGFGWAFGEAHGPKPEQLPAIRAALAQVNKALPPGELWPVERVRAAEACMLAANPDPGYLNQLYICGAWLSDDAGESVLAGEFRGKAWAAWTRTAGLSGKLADVCVAALTAARAGRHAEVLDRFRAAKEPLDTAAAAAAAEAAITRKAVEQRYRAWAATQPAGAVEPPHEMDDREIEELENPACRPTEAQLQTLYRVHALNAWRETLAAVQRRAALTTLGERKALELAATMPYEYRFEYIRFYGDSKDPATNKGIEGLIAKPMGPTTRPANMSNEEWENWAEGMTGKLRREWERMRAPPDVKKPLPDLKNDLATQRAHTPPDNYAIIDAASAIAEVGTPEASAILLEDFDAHGADYAGYWYEHRPAIEKALLADEPAVAKRAAESMQKFAAGTIKAEQPVAYLELLGQGRTAASLDFLRSALQSKDVPVRTAAAKALFSRGDKEGAKAFLTIADGSPIELEKLEPNLGAALVAAVDASMVDDLLKLRGHWAGKIERKDNDQRAMAGVTVRAALAKADPAKYLKDYEQAIDELVHSPIEGYEPARIPQETVVPMSMELLGWCINIHYVPHLGRLLRPLLTDCDSEYGLSNSIDLLARVRATDVADALAGQVDRPTPLGVKLSLCGAAGRLPIPGLEAAMRRWSASPDAQLQAAAREGLARLAGPATRPAPTPATRRAGGSE